MDIKKITQKSKRTEKLLQEFYDVNLTDPFLLEVADRYNKHLATTGEHSEEIITEGYDYLETKFQALQLKLKGKRRKLKESNDVID